MHKPNSMNQNQHRAHQTAAKHMHDLRDFGNANLAAARAAKAARVAQPGPADIDLGHNRLGGLDVAIFDADARSRTSHDRQQVLADLTAKARLANLKIDRSVLRFVENGRITYFGDQDLAQHLIRSRVEYRPNRRLTV